jgi:hypothetical protein
MKKSLLFFAFFMSTSHVWCVTYYSKAAATDFTATASWGDVADGSGASPASISTADAFIIANGSTMNLNAGNADVRSLTINAGSLTINSNTLTVEITGNNNTFMGVASGGTLTITGGTLILNGNAYFADGSGLTQSGGLFSIDPTGSSSVGAAPISTTANANKFSLTGGILRLVDPPANGSASALAVSTAASVYINCGAGHTLEIGDGISTTAGGNTAGFSINGALKLAYGNLTLNTVTNASNRHVTLATSIFTGNVTINSGSELRGGSRLSIAGNLTNNGILVISGTNYLAFENYSHSTTTSTPTTNAQTVSGTGTFKNAISGETSNAARLWVNNSNSAGVTFSSNITEFIVDGIINLTAGLVTMGTGTNTVTLGTSATVLGTLTYTAGRINGKFKRWVANASVASIVFPVGTSVKLRTATIAFTGATTTGGTLTTYFNPTSPGNRNLPQTFDGILVGNVSPTGFWNIESMPVLGGTYTATFDASAFTKTDGLTALGTANTRLLKAPTGGNFNASSVGTPGGFTTINMTGQTTFSDFAIGGTAGAVLPVEFQSVKAFSTGKSNSINWTTSSEQDLQIFGIERSADNQTWTQIGTQKATGGLAATTYEFTDEAPLALTYYRIRSIGNSGKDQLSKVVSVKRSNEKLSLSAVYPMPTSDVVTLDVVSHKSGKLTILTTDIVGKVIKSDIFTLVEGNNSLQLGLTQLAKGAYFLSLNNGEVTINQRIVKQ